MNAESTKKFMLWELLFVLLFSSCAPGALLGPTLTPTATITPSPLPTLTPTATPLPTATQLPTATPTPTPQSLLLRPKCGYHYIVNPDEPLQIYYGGWGVMGKDLANQWTTSLTVDLTIDGEVIAGKIQPPARELPNNCTASADGTYWVYFVTTIPGLSPGNHTITVVYNTLRALSDGVSSAKYPPGQIAAFNFSVTTR